MFIINPISGGKDKQRVPDMIERYLDKDTFDSRVSFTERVGHAYMLAKAAVKEDYHYIVAVGGDGTVNELAKALVNTSVILGIIPFGSGNGLARSLNIPMNIKEAVKVINRLQTTTIDSGLLNEDPFFNVAGLGFDAHISYVFASNAKRGLLGYVKSTLKELTNYKLNTYTIQIDNKTIKEKAFIVSVANSSQYGNEAHIAPRADLKDGLLDVVIVKKFPWYVFLSLVIRMFNKTADKSKYVESYQGKIIEIKRGQDGAIHLDGEPKRMDGTLNIRIVPQSIQVIVP